MRLDDRLPALERASRQAMDAAGEGGDRSRRRLVVGRRRRKRRRSSIFLFGKWLTNFASVGVGG